MTSALSDEVLRVSDNGVPQGAFVTAGSGGLNAPFSMAWGPDGDLYVGSSASVIRYDGSTGAYKETVVQGGNLNFGVNFASNGDLLVSLAGAKVVTRYDAATHALAATIPIPFAPSKLFPLPDGKLLVCNASGSPNQIGAIDLASNAFSVFANDPVLNSVFGMDLGPEGNLYVANDAGDHAFYKLNPSNGQLLGKVADSGLRSPSDVMFVPGNRFWTGDILTGTLNEFDASSGALVNSVTYGSSGYDLLYIPEPRSLSVAILAVSLSVARGIRLKSAERRTFIGI